MAYLFKRTVTIGGATSSTQTNFPALVKLDSSNCGTTLKTVGNGGHIQNTVTQSGGNAVLMPADLIFTSDSGGSTMIPWEVESYDATNGVLWVWVLIASLTTSGATVYMFYDDTTVNMQQNTSTFAPSAVWDANYKAVYHLPDGTSLLASDSTGVNNGTVTGTVTAAVGNIDGGAQNITTGTNGIRINDNASLRISSKLTLSAWIFQNSSNTNGAYLIQKRNAILSPDTNYNYSLSLDGSTSNKQQFQFNDGSYRTFNSNTGVTTGAWHYVVVTVDETSGTQLRFYLDGVADGTPAYSGAMPGTGTNPLQMTNIDQFNGGIYNIKGIEDEVRISNINRSADLIATEYANQNAPLTFNTIGAETSLSTNLGNFFLVI